MKILKKGIMLGVAVHSQRRRAKRVEWTLSYISNYYKNIVYIRYGTGSGIFTHRTELRTREKTQIWKLDI